MLKDWKFTLGVLVLIVLIFLRIIPQTENTETWVGFLAVVGFGAIIWEISKFINKKKKKKP